MRYREGTSPEELGSPIAEEITVGSAVFGLLLGVGFVIAGLRGRQLWLAVWGGMLVVASIAYLGAVLMGYA